MRLASENSYGICFCMKMAPTISLEVLSVVIAAYGACRDRFIKSISDKGISECFQMLSFSRCNIAFKSVTAPRVKKGMAGLGIVFLGGDLVFQRLLTMWCKAMAE
jgi:hypothetical protein